MVCGIWSHTNGFVVSGHYYIAEFTWVLSDVNIHNSHSFSNLTCNKLSKIISKVLHIKHQIQKALLLSLIIFDPVQDPKH